MTQTDQTQIRAQILEAAVMHVPFDGWSEETFQAAIRDADVDPAVAKLACPRGAVDLAMAHHLAGDQAMVERLKEADLEGMRFRDKIAQAVRIRLEVIEDKELVRRGTTLFSLPIYAGDGARAVWSTSDAIWDTLGDTSEDVNWYSKRMTLSGVYSATVLYWLGDDSLDHQATWDFLERRIDDVMLFEKVKAGVQKNPLLKPLLAGPNWLASQIKKPKPRDDLPGARG